MSWTYNTDISTDQDRIRLLLGDTNEDDPQLDDGEVDFLLLVNGSTGSAAVAGCRILVAKYARLCDKWVGDLKILASQKQLHYTRLLELLTMGGRGYEVPSAGGISVSQKAAYESDTDRSVPSFRRGMDDNPV